MCLDLKPIFIKFKSLTGGQRFLLRPSVEISLKPPNTIDRTCKQQGSYMENGSNNRRIRKRLMKRWREKESAGASGPHTWRVCVNE